ncbi:MAG: hypothetical protein JRJ77_08480 [Deltaproteobacteria bacterium]|nr:hypothetical protein [Deltaproteobacteria bacterium]MBW2339210.1 hypothetical protein [Deltaproteobacteria bacterium]
MEAFGVFYMIVAIFLIIVAILSLLMPFFVLRIRNEIISMNKKMSELIELLAGQSSTVKTEYSEYPGKEK